MAASVVLSAGLVLAYLYAFWCAYIAVMGVYRAHLNGRLTGFVRYLSFPLVVFGVALDVLAQYTLATVIFLDFPARGEHMVTSRLIRYIKTRTDWRYSLAHSVCTGMLDLFDPTGKHCA